MDPQGSLGLTPEKVTKILPNGAIGAVIVVESSVHQPDRPRYVGFWIPSPSLLSHFSAPKLRMSYHPCAATPPRRRLGNLHRVSGSSRCGRCRCEKRRVGRTTTVSNFSLICAKKDVLTSDKVVKRYACGR
jgi:hypothetical protein